MNESEERAEQRFRKALEDQWHAARVTLQRARIGEPADVEGEILKTQMVLLEAIYFLRTGRVLEP